MDGKNRSEVLIISQKKKTCDKKACVHCLTWDHLPLLSFYPLNYFPSRETIMILPWMLKNKKTNQTNKEIKKLTLTQKTSPLPSLTCVLLSMPPARPSVRPSVHHCALSVCVSTGPACQWWLQWQRTARRAPGHGCLGLRPSQLRSPWRSSEEWPMTSPSSSAARHPPVTKKGVRDTFKTACTLIQLCQY